ncbi:hypothetical protein CPT_Maja_102 [Burkholderia phage Maja]|uniref:Uncharacterized protein n=1 Tax=Burkholderia phage Maja TaxID=2767571 RepID=A0A7S6R8D2_9CAUD|nr:hypothetical protein CPT_Maja_102 [Burkholderia phage Maja]
MIRVTVYANFVERNPTLFAQDSDETIALKCIAAQFAAHCSKSGMRVDVHSEFILDVLKEDFGYTVLVEMI